jgi:hypothetical protein
MYRSSHVVRLFNFNFFRCHTFALVDHRRSLIPGLPVMATFASAYFRHKIYTLEDRASSSDVLFLSPPLLLQGARGSVVC